ncbi:fumarylacetoacetate hydrolase [Marinicaulis flavus]|uniref:Fumarylacetoacetate hydrolase n=1 Tax=Hyphococcus luteus TaxID=2058213 RepID=A0A2S7K0A9_9PROT|nr:fumarylacetoacetate hydrolase [Marinicaulis flavus]
MKLALIEAQGLGIIRDDVVIDASAAVAPDAERTSQELIEAVIEDFDALSAPLRELEQNGEGRPLSEARLLAPVPKPGKIVAMGANYLEGTDGPPLPIWSFFKSPQAILGPGGTVALPPADARVFHHEPELVLVIGRKCRNVAPADALDYVFGYTVGIDVSGRFPVLQQSLFNKSHDTFAPIGPWIVTADEIDDPQNLRVRLWVDGQPRHDFSTSDMGHGIRECIAFISSVTPLLPGDLVFTGTNHQGIGPIQDGETVTVEIEKIGRLVVNVSDPLERRWPKRIDDEMPARIRRMIKEGTPPGGISAHR